LLCACNEFGISRLKDGGESDLVSYVAFDHESRIVCEGVPLPDALQVSVPFSGGGTSFGQGLRAANEVLSRSDFEEYKAVLIFFSDGQPCDIELGISLAQHIRSSYAKYDFKAFAVGFGHVNLSVLQRVATELGGEYRQVLDANALRTEFQRIAAVLGNGEASLALLDSSADSP
jgi:Mg-chelatase subunit ChlD